MVRGASTPLPEQEPMPQAPMPPRAQLSPAHSGWTAGRRVTGEVGPRGEPHCELESRTRDGRGRLERGRGKFFAVSAELRSSSRALDWLMIRRSSSRALRSGDVDGAGSTVRRQGEC